MFLKLRSGCIWIFVSSPLGSWVKFNVGWCNVLFIYPSIIPRTGVHFGVTHILKGYCGQWKGLVLSDTPFGLWLDSYRFYSNVQREGQYDVWGSPIDGTDLAKNNGRKVNCRKINLDDKYVNFSLFRKKVICLSVVSGLLVVILLP